MKALFSKGLVVALTVAGALLSFARTPDDCVKPAHRMGGGNWWEKRHYAKLAEIKARPDVKVVFLGDSITDFWETRHAESWQGWVGYPEYAALNLGFSGDRTENVLWRLNNGEMDGYKAKVVVLMIGTNNMGHFKPDEEKPECAVRGIRAILDTIKARQPAAKVVLCAILPRGKEQDFADDVPARNAAVNAKIRAFADGKNVIWCEFGKEFLLADGKHVDTKLLPDQLHPSDAGYDLFGKAILPIVDRLLGIESPRQATEKNGNVVLVSREGQCIDRWLAPAGGNGAWKKLGVFANGRKVPGGMRNTGLAIGRDGTVYAGDANGRVLKFDLHGEYRGVFAETGFRPDNLAVSPDGKALYMTSLDAGHAGVYRAPLPAGAFVRIVDNLNQPRGVQFGPNDTLFVGCRGDNKVHVFDVTQGKAVHLGEIAAFNCAGAMAFSRADKTTLIVPGPKVEVFDLRKSTLATVPSDGEFLVALGACSVAGRPFAGCFRSGKIYAIGAKGPTEVAAGCPAVCAMANVAAALKPQPVRPAKEVKYVTPPPPPGADFARMKFNNPEAVIYLKAGFSGDRVLIADQDKDGQQDILVQSGETHFFRNPTPKGEKNLDPVFEAARYIDPKSVVWDANPAWGHGLDGQPIRNVHYTDGVKRKDFWVGRNSQGGDSHLIDLDGDGIEDMLVRAGDRRMDAWINCYDDRGNWKEIQLRSFLYWCKGVGDRKFQPPQMIYLENEMPLEVNGGWSTLPKDWDGDGDVDMLLFDFMDTIVYFENIGTKTKPVFTAGRFLRDDQGERLHGDLCLPRANFCDWDGDGLTDIVMLEEDARVGWFRNTGKVRDRLPVFEKVRYFRQHADELHFGALSCPWAYDWDGDGDEDIIVGNSHGQIAFIENLSGPGVEKPKWGPIKYLREPDGKLIWTLAGRSGSIQGPCEWKWGYMTLSVADWDGDGLPDIMGNNTMGTVFWWKNIGTRKQPKLDFARRVEVEWDGAQPALKWGWLKPERQKNPKELIAQWRTTPVMTDWNQDGLTDLVMLDSEGYLALYERAKDKNGKLIVKSPRRCFLDQNGGPLLMRCGFLNYVGCGRRKFCLCDWDGDGKLDIVANGALNAEVWLQTHASEKGWHFRPIGDVARKNLASHDPQPAACDFNGDGRPDLIFGAIDGYIYYLKNPKSK